MGGRVFHIAVIISWLLSMTWLFVEKVLPTIRRGENPAYDVYLAEAERAPEPAGWRIEWDGQQVGWAVVRSIRRPDGSVSVRNVVHFESLPIDRLVTELFGTLGPVVRQALLGRGELWLDIAVVTTTDFAVGGDLQSFVSRVHTGEVRDLMRVEGVVDDRRMEVTVFGLSETWSGGPPRLREMYRKEVVLPPNVLVSDSFSPQPRLVDLHVGQRWTFPVYRPFPPGSAAEIMEAQVEAETTVQYLGEQTRALRVVFRREAGSGISAAQEPTGRMWVRSDGTVLRQELRVANLRLTFDRTPEIQYRQKALRLDPDWQTPAPAGPD